MYRASQCVCPVRVIDGICGSMRRWWTTAWSWSRTGASCREAGSWDTWDTLDGTWTTWHIAHALGCTHVWICLDMPGVYALPRSWLLSVPVHLPNGSLHLAPMAALRPASALRRPTEYLEHIQFDWPVRYSCFEESYERCCGAQLWPHDPHLFTQLQRTCFVPKPSPNLREISRHSVAHNRLPSRERRRFTQKSDAETLVSPPPAAAPPVACDAHSCRPAAAACPAAAAPVTCGVHALCMRCMRQIEMQLQCELKNPLYIPLWDMVSAKVVEKIFDAFHHRIAVACRVAGEDL